ncbi:alpha/beta hydrolase family protein [Sodalinema gerasimenkoae]|uniref:alpha/beta hydrolase family protein n=1 Tax=Sodalinema gerasimenkoae TaxID=2862348 RepID=UPI00135926F7|nr:alpha/beta hydrolase [Sodalinema gerasimenkoae]
MSPLTSQSVGGMTVTLHYPAASDRPLALAVFLKGLNVAPSHYSYYAQRLAQYGFVVALPDPITRLPRRDELFASTGLFEDLQATLRREGNRVDSPLFQRVDSERVALLGHSQGGIVGLDAVVNASAVSLMSGDYSLPSQLKAAVFYGSVLDVEFIGDRPLNHHDLPMALMVGSRDSLMPAAEVRDTYERLQNPPKLYLEVEGANHYGITNVNNPPQAPLDPRLPDIPQEIALENLARWSGVFLRAWVLEDAIARAYLQQMLGTSDPVVSLQGEL